MFVWSPHLPELLALFQETPVLIKSPCPQFGGSALARPPGGLLATLRSPALYV